MVVTVIGSSDSSQLDAIAVEHASSERFICLISEKRPIRHKRRTMVKMVDAVLAFGLRSLVTPLDVP